MSHAQGNDLPTEDLSQVKDTQMRPSKPQSKSQQDELDEILSQAFTDGASDTMWQNDRHVEIYATAKARLQSYIDKAVAQEANKARIDEIKWALSRTSMDELKERYEALTAQNKDRA